MWAPGKCRTVFGRFDYMPLHLVFFFFFRLHWILRVRCFPCAMSIAVEYVKNTKTWKHLWENLLVFMLKSHSKFPYGSMPHEIILFSAAGTRRPNTHFYSFFIYRQTNIVNSIGFRLPYSFYWHIAFNTCGSGERATEQRVSANRWRWELFGSILVHKTYVKAAGRIHSYFSFFFSLQPVHLFIYIYDFSFEWLSSSTPSSFGNTYSALTSEYSLIGIAVAGVWAHRAE